VILIFSKHLFPLGCLNYHLSLRRTLKDEEHVLTLLTINSAEGCVDPVEVLVGMRGKEWAHRADAASPLPTGADSARLQQAKRLEPRNQAVLPDCWSPPACLSPSPKFPALKKSVSCNRPQQASPPVQDRWYSEVHLPQPSFTLAEQSCCSCLYCCFQVSGRMGRQIHFQTFSCIPSGDGKCLQRVYQPCSCPMHRSATRSFYLSPSQPGRSLLLCHPSTSAKQTQLLVRTGHRISLWDYF